MYHRAAMTSTRTAIVLGGSGSVGTSLLRALFHDDGFDAVITLSRRSLPEAVAMARTAGCRLVEKLVPEMKPAPLAAATIDAASELDGDLEGFSVLGIGAGTAKLTIEEHRAVDVALNEAFARALRDSGKVRHLAYMSAAGADPTAKASGSGAAGMSRYNRVKGESEAAVRASGPAIVSVFRPAMIIGSQHTPWLLEKTLPLLSFVTPAKYRSISVEQIAKAMIATAKHHPATSATYHYPEMMALIASGQR
nr:NAD(P)H-binding protein [Nannocystis sp.]